MCFCEVFFFLEPTTEGFNFILYLNLSRLHWNFDSVEEQIASYADRGFGKAKRFQTVRPERQGW